ncbi:MAG: hypothetical protein WKF35_04035 [Ferruginibacter sp.]
MKTYSFLLPDERAKTYRYITLFILLINCFVFGFLFINASDERTHSLSRFGLLLSVIYTFMYFVKSYTKYLSRYKLEVSFIVLGILWLVTGNLFFAGILLFCAIAGIYVSRKQMIIVSAEKIFYPSFPAKEFLWDEITNVILKDEVLTIDLKNNKLLQSVIVSEKSNEINEEEFNSFCKVQLNK